jgi:transposase
VARRAIEATEVSRCWSWEQDATAGSYPPMDLCLAEVRRSDVLVLILGRRLTDNTRQEYELAATLGIPRSVFVKDTRLLSDTRKFLTSIQSEVTYEKFGRTSPQTRPRRSADELGGAIGQGRQDSRGWQKLLPPRAFQVLPRRWVVERSFAWIGHNRRMSKDYEKLCATSEAFVYAAMSRLMLRRLART